MSKKKQTVKRQKSEKIEERKPLAISHISVSGFKSISSEQGIDIKPLTVLAGANNAGKSSIIQPLLLLKQTLESPYDAGPLKIDGPLLYFTANDQYFSRNATELVIKLSITNGESVCMKYRKRDKGGVDIRYISLERPKRGKSEYYPDMTHEDIINSISPQSKAFFGIREDSETSLKLKARLRKCFFEYIVTVKGREGEEHGRIEMFSDYYLLITGIIHLSGIRGTPSGSRSMPISQPHSEHPSSKSSHIKDGGYAFPGPFAPYYPSIIEIWQSGEPEKIANLNRAMETLAITNSVKTRRPNEAALEVVINRIAEGSCNDLVSIADVGFGVSQVLPVIVALLVASPGQLVIIEQPELHLHPDAQYKLAWIIANAANRGVRVVIETHSDILLLGIQTVIAKKEMKPEDVIMHWFERIDGVTKITSVTPEKDGSYGDWPEDFADIALRAHKEYLDI